MIINLYQIYMQYKSAQKKVDDILERKPALPYLKHRPARRCPKTLDAPSLLIWLCSFGREVPSQSALVARLKKEGHRITNLDREMIRGQRDRADTIGPCLFRGVAGVQKKRELKDLVWDQPHLYVHYQVDEDLLRRAAWAYYGNGWAGEGRYTSWCNRYVAAETARRAARTAYYNAKREALGDGRFKITWRRKRGSQGVIDCSSSTESYYKYGRWTSETDTARHICLHPDYHLRVSSIDFVGGMRTLDAVSVPHDEADVWEAVWLSKGRGYALKENRGYIVHRGGIAVHGKSIKGALRLLRRREKNAELTPEQWAARSVNGQAKISLADARSAGMCDSGINDFLSSCGLPSDGCRSAQDLIKLCSEHCPRHLGDLVSVIRSVAGGAA